MNHVLVVDDEKDIRELVKGLLEDEGYQVSTAANSSEFYAVLERQVPDVILLDIWLEESEQDGITLGVL